MYFSSTIRIKKCTGFKRSAFLRCLFDLQICSSNVFFINNPDPDTKLRLKADPKKNHFGSTTLILTCVSELDLERQGSHHFAGFGFATLLKQIDPDLTYYPRQCGFIYLQIRHPTIREIQHQHKHQ
jgi:hypothetical protein